MFFSNSAFISLSTFIIVRFLRYPKKEFIDEDRERSLKRWITFFVIITIIPSTYLAYQTVRQSIFERNAMSFIEQELMFDNTRVINQVLTYDGKNQCIEVSLFGDPVPEEMIENARAHLPNYRLTEVELVVYQGYDEQMSQASIASSLRSGIIEEMYKQNNEQSLRSKDERIKLLEMELTRMKRLSSAPGELYPELKALFPTITDFTINNNLLIHKDGNRADSVYLAYVKFSRKPVKSDLQKLESWLKARFKSDKIKLVTE